MLKWTKEKPKEDGMYWCRFTKAPAIEPFLLRVSKNDSDWFLTKNFINNKNVEFSDQPIPLPKEEEEI